MSPLVSVIIPTYKRDISLERAIKSVMNQTYSNIEIIVIDDNNPLDEYSDKTSKIISKFQSNDKLLFIKNGTNIGSARTRNVGIKNSTGEYITFLDDDDLYECNKIKNQVEFMVKNDIDMSFTDLILKDKNDKIFSIRNYEKLNNFDEKTLIRYHLMNHITGTDTFMYKRELLEKLRGFDPIDIGDEFYLMYKTIKSGAKIGYLPTSDVIAYVHDSKGGLSTSENKIKGEGELYEFKKKHFNALSFNDRMSIKARHHAVLGYSYFKLHKYILAAFNLFIGFIANPKYIINLYLNNYKVD